MLILGSSSIARKELLSSVGLVPDKVEIPGVDERHIYGESPQHYVRRVAGLKASAISCDRRSYLITADTIVCVGKRVLTKTFDELKANEYLNLLSGRRHNVFTAFCVKHNGFIVSNSVKTSLRMKLLTKGEISAYLSSGEWVGCAGAYSIQGKAKSFFPYISGCYSNVIGLPLPKLVNILRGLGYQK